MVIQIVEHLHADKRHSVWLLRNGRSNCPTLDELESLRIGVHGHHNLARDVVAIEHTGHFFPGLGLQAYEGIVQLVFFLADDLASWYRRRCADRPGYQPRA